MAEQAKLGSEFASWTSLPSISEAFQNAAKGQFNPLMYAAGYALDKLGGSSDTSQKMMANAAPPPSQPAIGQGLGLSSGPSIPPNGGMGLSAPAQNMFGYTPQTNVMSQPGLGQPPALGQSLGQPQASPLDAWKNLSFNNLNRRQ